eukprot:609280-Rhodomonas_salina.1
MRAVWSGNTRESSCRAKRNTGNGKEATENGQKTPGKETEAREHLDGGPVEGHGRSSPEHKAHPAWYPNGLREYRNGQSVSTEVDEVGTKLGSVSTEMGSISERDGHDLITQHTLGQYRTSRSSSVRTYARHALSVPDIA